MTSAFAPSNTVARTGVRAGADARALAVAAMQTMYVIVVPPRSQGPGRP